jgi:hypothetical protein
MKESEMNAERMRVGSVDALSKYLVFAREVWNAMSGYLLPSLHEFSAK